MPSRDLNHLQPEFRVKIERMQELASFVGFELLIYCTRRTLTEQARIFRVGRSLAVIERKADELSKEWGRPDLAHLLMDVGPQHGPSILTQAGPGQSFHNYDLAADGVPLRDEQPVWSTTGDAGDLWREFGRLAQRAGLEWGGNWARFKDYPHLQQPGLSWRSLIASVGL